MKRFAIFLRSRLGNGFSDFGLALILAMALYFETQVSAEIVFQDFFRQPATNLTNSVPWIDVDRNGWQTGAAASQLVLDGSGRVYNAAENAGTAAGVPLIPIGLHGSMTASALLKLPIGSTEWIGIGFANSNLLLSANGSGSGPWLQVQRNGNMTIYSGTGLNNAATVANASTNNGNPVQVFLTCDAFHTTASAGTISRKATNLVFNQWPLALLASQDALEKAADLGHRTDRQNPEPETGIPAGGKP